MHTLQVLPSNLFNDTLEPTSESFYLVAGCGTHPL
jgi:hypothetical protein